MRVGLSVTIFRIVTKPPYAARFGNSFVVSDKVKNGSNDFCRYEYNELNASEPMMKPRKGKRRCQKWVVTFVSMIRVYRKPDYWVHGIRG